MTKFTTLANFNANKRQLEAWKKLFNSQCKYLLYGGAAHGGKSYFLRWAAASLGMYYSSKYDLTNVPIGLFSEDYPTLKDRQISRIKHEFPKWLGKLREDRDEGYMFESYPKYGSFRILLRNLDDPPKYASAEFAAIFVEELTKNPVDTFEDLRFRLRYKPIGKEVKFVGATNPGGIGHAWVKKLWIEPDPENPDPEQDRFFFIRSLPTDNPYTTDDYIKQLKSMPEDKRKAWLEGSWDVFEGQVFTEWKRGVHTIKPFKIPHEWKKYIALDWGANKPFAVNWIADDYDGHSFVYREMYMNAEEFEAKFNKPLTAKRLAKVILGITEKNKEEYEYCVADPSMWNKILLGEKTTKDTGESYAEIMTNAGLKMMKGDNDRENGLARFREALSPLKDNKPELRVFSSCYNTIRTIPSLVYDSHKVEDVDTDGEDHIYDALRYYFMSRPYPAQKTKKKLSKIQRHKQKVIERWVSRNEQIDEWAAW